MKKQMQGFNGFPAGKLATTPVPNLFFAELLPLIDHLGELKVTLHLLWLIGRKSGPLKYARLSELLADQRLLQGLESISGSSDTVLQDSLERGVARGSLLHATVQRGETTEEWYMINSSHGREVMEKLQAGDLDVMAHVAEDVQLQVERPNIFVLYEQNIGLLTPMIADELRDAERQYPADWIADAFREAVVINKRSWRYILRILERWRVDGKDAGQSPSEAPAGGRSRRRRYVPKGYEGLIEH